jgi:hypothetical protein
MFIGLGVPVNNAALNAQKAQTQPIVIVSDGLRLYLDASDLSGTPTTWTDRIGSMVFTLENSPAYNSDYGGYLQFTQGNNNYARSDHNLPTLDNWSIEVWHYYDGNNAIGLPCLFSEFYGGGDINLTLGAVTAPPDHLQMGFYSTSNGGWQATASDYALTPGAWYHIVGTYDGTNLKLYVNGTLVRTAAGSGSHTAGSGGYVLMNRWDGDNYWSGKLSVVRVYDKGLTQSDVTNNYSAENTRFGL